MIYSVFLVTSTPTSSSSTTSPTTSTSSSPTPTSHPKKSTPIGAIVGGVVGGVAVIAIALIAIFLILRRRKNKTPVQSGGHNGDFGAAGAHSEKTEAKYEAQSPPYSPTLASTSPGMPPKSPDVHYANFPSPTQGHNVQPPLVGGGYQSHSPVPPQSHTPMPTHVSELPSDSVVSSG
jgi:hypothetical protein